MTRFPRSRRTAGFPARRTMSIPPCPRTARFPPCPRTARFGRRRRTARRPRRRSTTRCPPGPLRQSRNPVSEATPPPGAQPGPDGLPRCPWALSSPDYLAYHYEEWGRPVRDDAGLFERLSLEAFQSGLSWLTILRKRDNFRAAFGGFDPAVVAAFGPADEARLLADPGIVRNRAKISAVIGNARAAQAVPGGLAAFVWRYAGAPA